MNELQDNIQKGTLPTYWENEIKEKRAKQLSNVQAEKTARLPRENNHIAIENMTPAEFRDRLKGMGVTTRVRNIKKLQQMCINAMEAAV